MTSIAFPVIGTGNLNFPPDAASRIMLEETIGFCQANPSSTVKDVRFVVFQQDHALVTAFEQEMTNLQSKHKFRPGYTVSGLFTFNPGVRFRQAIEVPVIEPLRCQPLRSKPSFGCETQRGRVRIGEVGHEINEWNQKIQEEQEAPLVSKNVEWSYKKHGTKMAFGKKTNAKIEMAHSKKHKISKLAIIPRITDSELGKNWTHCSVYEQ